MDEERVGRPFTYSSLPLLIFAPAENIDFLTFSGVGAALLYFIQGLALLVFV